MTATGTDFRRAAGERIGAYELVAPLGRGGFSEVWTARRVVSRAGERPEVALKLLVHPEHLAQLRAEASSLSLVRGPGIVGIREVSLDSDPPFLALELQDGGDLRTRLGGGKLEPTAAVRVFEAILEVMARVHRDGVVHGDLKPENVLFSGANTNRDPAEGLAIADFGLSRRIAQRSASLSVSLSVDDARLAGTLDYMAPEQREGQRPTPRSDVYALGVIFYELLLGVRPQGVFAMPTQRIPALPPVVDNVLASALAREPGHRFETAGALLAALRAGLRDDWRELASAHANLTALEKLSAAGQLENVEGFLGAFLVVLGTLAFVGYRVSVSKAIPLPPNAWSSVWPPAAIATLGTVLLWFALAPWLRARLRAIAELRDRIALQIKTGADWATVVKPPTARVPGRTFVPRTLAVRAPREVPAIASFVAVIVAFALLGLAVHLRNRVPSPRPVRRVAASTDPIDPLEELRRRDRAEALRASAERERQRILARSLPPEIVAELPIPSGAARVAWGNERGVAATRRTLNLLDRRSGSFLLDAPDEVLAVAVTDADHHAVVATATELFRVRLPDGTIASRTRLARRPCALAVSRDGRTVYLSDGRGTLERSAVAGGGLDDTVREAAGRPLTVLGLVGPSDELLGLGPEGGLRFSSDGTRSTPIAVKAPGLVAISWGRIAWIDGGGALRVRAALDAGTTRVLEARAEGYRSLVVSQELVAAADDRGTIAFWDIATGDALPPAFVTPPVVLAFASETTLVAGTPEGVTLLERSR